MLEYFMQEGAQEEKWPDNNPERRLAAERFSEYAIGIILLLKGWEEAPHFHDFPCRVIFIFLAGIFIIAGTKFHSQLARSAKSLPGIFHLLEGLVEIIVACTFLEEGMHWLPPFVALIGLHFCSLGLVHLLASEEKRENAFSVLRVVQGIVFIVFAVAIAVANALSTPKPEVLFCAALLVFVGIRLIVKRTAHQQKRISLAFRLFEYLRQRRAARSGR